jgi:uncharacterized protein (TIGR02246 family)
MTEDERAIRGVIATWMRASSEGDTETVLGLMADDVVFFVPGRAFGKEEFAAAQQGLAGARLEAASNVREVRVSGDWAFASTDLSIVMTPAGGGEPVRRSGNTLSVFQRLPDGRWVLARDANLLAVR